MAKNGIRDTDERMERRMPPFNLCIYVGQIHVIVDRKSISIDLSYTRWVDYDISPYPFYQLLIHGRNSILSV